MQTAMYYPWQGKKCWDASVIYYLQVDNPAYHDPNLYPIKAVARNNHLYSPQINNITFLSPSYPPLTQTNDEADSECGPTSELNLQDNQVRSWDKSAESLVSKGGGTNYIAGGSNLPTSWCINYVTLSAIINYVTSSALLGMLFRKISKRIEKRKRN